LTGREAVVLVECAAELGGVGDSDEGGDLGDRMGVGGVTEDRGGALEALAADCGRDPVGVVG
jgi:hypothetical protein